MRDDRRTHLVQGKCTLSTIECDGLWNLFLIYSHQNPIGILLYSNSRDSRIFFYILLINPLENYKFFAVIFNRNSVAPCHFTVS